MVPSGADACFCLGFRVQFRGFWGFRVFAWGVGFSGAAACLKQLMAWEPRTRPAIWSAAREAAMLPDTDSIK